MNMEKNVINIEGTVGEDHTKSSKSSEATKGQEQKASDATPQAANNDDPQTDYSSKAKNHTTFSHYWVRQSRAIDCFDM